MSITRKFQNEEEIQDEDIYPAPDYIYVPSDDEGLDAFVSNPPPRYQEINEYPKRKPPGIPFESEAKLLDKDYKSEKINREQYVQALHRLFDDTVSYEELHTFDQEDQKNCLAKCAFIADTFLWVNDNTLFDFDPFMDLVEHWYKLFKDYFVDVSSDHKKIADFREQNQIDIPPAIRHFLLTFEPILKLSYFKRDIRNRIKDAKNQDYKTFEADIDQVVLLADKKEQIILRNYTNQLLVEKGGKRMYSPRPKIINPHRAGESSLSPTSSSSSLFSWNLLSPKSPKSPLSASESQLKKEYLNILKQFERNKDEKKAEQALLKILQEDLKKLTIFKFLEMFKLLMQEIVTKHPNLYRAQGILGYKIPDAHNHISSSFNTDFIHEVVQMLRNYRTTHASLGREERRAISMFLRDYQERPAEHIVQSPSRKAT